jgi:hypothetical protein
MMKIIETSESNIIPADRGASSATTITSDCFKT